MNGVRAEWHLSDLTDDTIDPMGTVAYSTGVTIDLTAPEEELQQLLTRLMLREGRLFDTGITCGYKDNGQDCLTCPHATLDVGDKQSVLCRLGKDEQTVANRLQDRRRAQEQSVGDLADEAGAASELGELDPELAEFLTAVGL